jgi:hypothetical protein
MAIYKRGKIYWYKFMWKGEVMRESTRQADTINRIFSSQLLVGTKSGTQKKSSKSKKQNKLKGSKT